MGDRGRCGRGNSSTEAVDHEDVVLAAKVGMAEIVFSWQLLSVQLVSIVKIVVRLVVGVAVFTKVVDPCV